MEQLGNLWAAMNQSLLEPVEHLQAFLLSGIRFVLHSRFHKDDKKNSSLAMPQSHVISSTLYQDIDPDRKRLQAAL